ncbi:sugar transporter [Fusarium pseudocircinatum]|uniref:Sugar transporter n=1 Tax=Fusarium pseudocircinatum TaxID=56676 RepID=A0A8H5NTB5_9HYPO|nr:sugar transporter [Fusarium pseudocircinatum]
MVVRHRNQLAYYANKGAALGSAANWIFNFVVVEITPIGIQNLGWRFYLIWTVLNAAVVPVVYVFYPETAGRTLEDLYEYFRSNPPLILCRDKEAISSKRPEKYRLREKELLQKKDGVVAQHVKRTRHDKYQVLGGPWIFRT